MISKGKPPTAKELQWRKDVVEWCRGSGFMWNVFGSHAMNPMRIQIHHCVGSQAKVKVNLWSVKIGEFYILCLPAEYHCILEHGNNPLNITNNKKAFEREFGTEKQLFEQMVNGMKLDGYTIPFDYDVLQGVLRR